MNTEYYSQNFHSILKDTNHLYLFIFENKINMFLKSLDFECIPVYYADLLSNQHNFTQCYLWETHTIEVLYGIIN